MRTYCRIVLLAVLAAVPAAGCGCGSNRGPDNSNVQTPDDQPLGTPKPLGGDKKEPKGQLVPLGAEKKELQGRSVPVQP
jgi:hypothetical protein